jgi:iron complex transport system substrate-binding protein
VAAQLPSRPDVISLDPSTLAGVFADVERLADAAQVPEAGRELRAGLETRLAATRERVAGAPRPTVLALEWLDPPFLGGHWVPEMIAIAGGEALLSEAGEKSREVAWMELQHLGPDHAVVMPCGYYVEESSRQANQNADQLAALGAGQIWVVDAASSFSRPGPRLVDGVELLAHLLHPDRADAPEGINFEPFDVSAAAPS